MSKQKVRGAMRYEGVFSTVSKKNAPAHKFRKSGYLNTAPSSFVSLFQRQRVVLPRKHWRSLWELSTTNMDYNRRKLKSQCVPQWLLMSWGYLRLLRGWTLGCFMCQVLKSVGLGTVVYSHVNFMALYYCVLVCLRKTLRNIWGSLNENTVHSTTAIYHWRQQCSKCPPRD
jgi:hypothetical protein